MYDLLVVEDEGVGVGRVGEGFAEGVFDVGDESALAAIGKLHAYEGVEAHATGAEEGESVHRAVVEGFDVARVDHADGSLGVDGELEVACESVATAAGDDAQRRVGVDEGACYFVDRAVASYCYDNVDALACSLVGDYFGMTSVLRVAHAVRVLARVNTAPDALADVYLSVCAGFGIDDEEYGLHRNVGGIKRLGKRSGGVRVCGAEVFF